MSRYALKMLTAAVLAAGFALAAQAEDPVAATKPTAKTKAKTKLATDDVESLFYMAADRLVIIRLHLRVDGKSHQKIWRELTDKYQKLGVGGKHAARAASIDSMDQAIGKVLDTLEQEGMAKNTLAMFFCDNGSGSPIFAR